MLQDDALLYLLGFTDDAKLVLAPSLKEHIFHVYAIFFRMTLRTDFFIITRKRFCKITPFFSSKNSVLWSNPTTGRLFSSLFATNPLQLILSPCPPFHKIPLIPTMQPDPAGHFLSTILDRCGVFFPITVVVVVVEKITNSSRSTL